MRVKSSIAAVLASALALTGLAACGHANDANNGPTDNAKSGGCVHHFGRDFGLASDNQTITLTDRVEQILAF